MSSNFINWLLGIGPNQFTPEQQLPHPPKEDKQKTYKTDDDEYKNYTQDSTSLGPPRC